MKKSRTALICLDGEPPHPKTLQFVLKHVDFVVAADGGANWLFEAGIAPDVLIGDLDGVKRKVLTKIPSTQVIQIKDQYSTDLEKAFSWVTQNKIQHVIVLAGTGKRIDHTFCNFFLLWKYAHRISIEMIHDDFHGYFLNNHAYEFLSQPGTTFSLIPFSSCSGITLKGFQFQLTKARMKLGEVGVSNVVEKSHVHVHVRKGRALAIFIQEQK